LDDVSRKWFTQGQKDGISGLMRVSILQSHLPIAFIVACVNFIIIPTVQFHSSNPSYIPRYQHIDALGGPSSLKLCLRGGSKDNETSVLKKRRLDNEANTNTPINPPNTSRQENGEDESFSVIEGDDLPMDLNESGLHVHESGAVWGEDADSVPLPQSWRKLAEMSWDPRPPTPMAMTLTAQQQPLVPAKIARATVEAV
jgi:hypothetical protein